jgi:uncharacterized surface protein with fasciclin (FAS1) repeats
MGIKKTLRDWVSEPKKKRECFQSSERFSSPNQPTRSELQENFFVKPVESASLLRINPYKPKQNVQLARCDSKIFGVSVMKISAFLVAAVLTVVSGSCFAQTCPSQGGHAEVVSTVAPAQAKDIVDTAVAGKFNTLVAAVKAAGLVDTLKGKGPFTVFAPTDEAFAKLPKGTLEDLLKPENKDKLVAILTYHVVPGSVKAAAVKDGLKAKTVQGSEVSFKINGKDVTIDNAKIIKTDIETSNGVIHVIDTVILPPAKK